MLTISQQAESSDWTLCPRQATSNKSKRICASRSRAELQPGEQLHSVQAVQAEQKLPVQKSSWFTAQPGVSTGWRGTRPVGWGGTCSTSRRRGACTWTPRDRSATRPDDLVDLPQILGGGCKAEKAESQLDVRVARGGSCPGGVRAGNWRSGGVAGSPKSAARSPA